MPNGGRARRRIFLQSHVCQGFWQAINIFVVITTFLTMWAMWGPCGGHVGAGSGGAPDMALCLSGFGGQPTIHITDTL
jgi:hypothetical protein